MRFELRTVLPSLFVLTPTGKPATVNDTVDCHSFRHWGALRGRLWEALVYWCDETDRIRLHWSWRRVSYTCWFSVSGMETETRSRTCDLFFSDCLNSFNNLLLKEIHLFIDKEEDALILIKQQESTTIFHRSEHHDIQFLNFILRYDVILRFQSHILIKSLTLQITESWVTSAVVVWMKNSFFTARGSVWLTPHEVKQTEQLRQWDARHLIMYQETQTMS